MIPKCTCRFKLRPKRKPLLFWPQINRIIAAWCCKHSLSLNPYKTKLLLLGTHQMPEDFHRTLLWKQIMPVPSLRDFRTILYFTLTYNKHATEVVSRCTARPMSARVKRILERQSLIKNCNAFVFGRLYYRSSVLSVQHVKEDPYKIAKRAKLCQMY